VRAPRSGWPPCREMLQSRSTACSRSPDRPMSGRLDWLIARPVAHRGLHDAQRNIIENTPAAFAAAVASGYGIECDLQVSADGEAMLHHDAVLGRLTEGTARLGSISAAALKQGSFKNTTDQ